MDHDLDFERDRGRLRQSYRSCWIGFSLYGLFLAAGSIEAIATLFLQFAGLNPHLGYWLGINPYDFDFGFNMVRTWERLLACFALAAAWPAVPLWRRRAGLLLVMAIADVALWSVTYSVPLGLASEPTRHLVFCHYLSMALGWSRFLLVANLASDFAAHAQIPRAAEFGSAARKAATTGAALWFGYFLLRINWRHPWPLVERRLTFDAFQLFMACRVLNLLCLVQATFLTLLASRAASQSLRQMAREDEGYDPWASPSATSATM